MGEFVWVLVVCLGQSGWGCGGGKAITPMPDYPACLEQMESINSAPFVGQMSSGEAGGPTVAICMALSGSQAPDYPPSWGFTE